jgi:hypothetical protein
MPSCEHNCCTNCLKQKIVPNSKNIIVCNVCQVSEEIYDADLEYFPKNIGLIKLLKAFESSKQNSA